MKKIILFGFILLILISIAYARIDIIAEQGIEKEYVEDGISYKINAVYIHQDKVKFIINNETSDLLSRHDDYRFSDKSIIYVNEILEEEVPEAPDKVSFNFWPGICATPYCNFTEKIDKKIPEIVEEAPEEIKEVPEKAPDIVEEIPEVEEAVPAEEAKECLFIKIIRFILDLFR